MRRLSLLSALLLPWLLPAPAAANDAFCPALQRLVAGARWSFNDIGLAPHLIPGSVAERRGVVQILDGPPRGAIFAVMQRVQGREHEAQIVHGFDQLHGRIAQCLPDAQASPTSRAPTEVRSTWTTPYAVVLLRADRGDGFAATMDLEIVVASRW
jgi:hypothetical protein